MQFTKLTEIELPAAFDAHVHLRDGEMSQLVTPTIRKGGVNQVYVMVRELASFCTTSTSVHSKPPVSKNSHLIFTVHVNLSILNHSLSKMA
jgi:dihydroorotase